MGQIFLEIWNQAFTASWIIIVVLALRLFLKKAPKWTVCLLWGLVAARLAFPFQLESRLCLIPDTDVAPVNITDPVLQDAAIGTQAADGADTPVTVKRWRMGPPQAMAGPGLIWVTAGCAVWILGAAGMMLYAFTSFLLLRKKVSASIQVLDDVYICDGLKSPFILGIFRPRIYLPSGIDADTAEYVLVHERMHLKRWDHIWKPFGFYILSVYWFHPLCWAAYILFCRDMEYACDEKATKHMDKSRRADYCQALLVCSTKKRRIGACPVAFGETGVKGRIRSVLYYKKPAFWIVAASLAACVFVAVCFLTNPKEKRQDVRMAANAEGSYTKNKKNAGEQDEIRNGITAGMREGDQNEITAGMQEGDQNGITPAGQDGGQDEKFTGMENIASIVEHAQAMSREGYQEADISYVDNAKVGWDYFSENPWRTEQQRDLLAQAALRELYTLTGTQLKECVYTTDGRSRFIFGKSGDAIRRATAFYTRDYGWMLAGGNTPHMGFVNARRVWYSDIQQLDSPYHDPQYQGHGAVPAWFLTHSGVYQGEKVRGFDVYDVEDTTFTHVKLLFDGGYYVVVMDEGIESAAEVFGPYYDSAGEEGPDYGADCLGLAR